jgi:serine/threonine-protein kinase
LRRTILVLTAVLALASCDRQGVTTHPVRVTLDGTTERLPSTPEPARDPVTTRDGRYRLVAERHRDTGWDLLVLDLESDSSEPFLATEADEMDAALSPNGRWVAYASDATDRHEIYIRRFPAERREWQVSFTGGRSPLWSTDGTEIYYRAADGNVRAVRVDPSEFSVRIGSDRALFEDRFARGEDAWALLPDGSFLMRAAD